MGYFTKIFKPRWKAKRQRLLKKRESLYSLDSREKAELAEFKENAWRHLTLGRGYCERFLKHVNNEHKKDFRKIVQELQKLFPKEKIKVLDEGAGESYFSYEMEEKNPRVEVTRTDVLYDPELDTKNHRKMCPEELVEKFGKKSFHLIVSTYGGLNYTRINQVKGLINVIELLKPGGIASIATTETHEFTGGEPIFLPEKWRKKLERLYRVSITEEAFPMGRHKDRNYSVLTIKRPKLF